MRWTEKVDARTRLAAELKARAETRPLSGLKMRDLDALIAHGTAARQADRAQQGQLADASALRSSRASGAQDLATHERRLRDVIPAVLADLVAAGHAQQALTLQRVSFAQFRLRGIELPNDATPPTEEEAETLRRFERVERKDSVSRARAVEDYCAFLLEPGREVLAAAFAERDVSRADLEATIATAQGLIALGRNTQQAAEATQREHDAVVAQQQVWNAVRRLVRAAVLDDPHLSQLYAAC